MKKLMAFLLATALFLGCAVFMTSCNSSSDKYTVGIIQLAPHSALDAATQGFQDALVAELGEDKVSFLFQNAQGEATTCTTIVNDFVTKNVDLIMANATAALQAASNATDDIPVVGTSITAYGVALKLDDFNGTVGTNVTGASDLANLKEQANMIKLFPDAQTVALLYCSAEPNSDYQVKEVKKYLEEMGYTTELFPFSDSNDVAAVATAASAKDVIYIPTDNTAATCAGAIYGAIGDTPVIAGEEAICKGCGVVTLTISYYDMGYVAGQMAAKILKGEAEPESMPIEIVPDAKQVKKYNATRCAELNIDVAALEAAGFVAIEGTEVQG
ncbi:MAG: ABC transporter substrate-binding protein [Ruminococcaceae bacterium]|nr:ABC transporter substrate-binding protein [Oscillospiraceae bacterium]